MSDNQSTTILAIESSCDDTAAAIFKDEQLLSTVVSSQIEHKELGGVVPEIASRAHLKNMNTVVELALNKADVRKEDIDAIAYTQGPGLMGSLLVGAGFAKGFSIAQDIPLIGIHHMEAHVLAHFIEKPAPEFPFLCLTVSGGHTQIVIMHDYFEMEVLGATIDDAAGEAFDKAGKMLGLPYPAGPVIDRMSKEGNPVYEFAKPKIPELNFSFSGLKTSILYFLQAEMKKDEQFITNNLNDLCASIQKSITDILIDKLEMAIEQTGIKQVTMAGGVSANSELRQKLSDLETKYDIETFSLPLKFCVDNAAMIGMAAYYKLKKGMTTPIDASIFTQS